MYIYKVTHVPTKRYYFGFSDEDISNCNHRLDPGNKFPEMGHNGNAPMVNVSKNPFLKVGTKNEAIRELTNLAKAHENNSEFLGIFNSPDKVSEPIVNTYIQEEE